MEIILSAIAAGGLVGAADQYLCLLLVAIAGKAGWITLASPMSFLTSWWFIGVSAVFWLVSIAPAYATLLSPGVMNVVNTIHKFLSGFLVPISSALIALASVGIIIGLDPELKKVLDSLRIFGANGGIGATGWAIGGASGLVGLSLTGMKALAKPAASASTGTMGHLSAPMFITLENIASVVLMGLVYLLSKIDPWLLVGLLGLVILMTLAMLAFAIYQMWRLKKGIGRVLYLVETKPKAGLALVAEFLVWGSGWMIWQKWGRGVFMLFIWIICLMMLIMINPIIVAAFAFFPPAIPIVVFMVTTFLVIVFVAVGLGSAGALMKKLDTELLAPVSQ